MRDPTRMPKILQKLQTLWEKYPDMRFCQLLASINGGVDDDFYIEDDVLLQRIRKIMAEGF